jgi:hypothetical protein
MSNFIIITENCDVYHATRIDHEITEAFMNGVAHVIDISERDEPLQWSSSFGQYKVEPVEVWPGE